MNSRLLKFCVVVLMFAVVAVFAFTPQAQAATRRLHIAVMPQGPANSEAKPDYGAAPAANLYGIAAYFGAEPLNTEICTTTGCTNENPWSGPYPGTTSATPPNDLWPCFGDDTAQPDCTYIGSASGQTSLPTEVVLGNPAYTWYLTANTATTQPYGCDATATADTYHFCAQAINFYEDDSNDTTDDLIWSMVVTQGSSTIYDSGTQDYGPNPYGGLLASTGVAPVIVFYEDLNFGIPNGGAVNADGPCFASYNYPVTNTTPPAGSNTYEGLVNTFGAYFGVAGTKTCVAPAAGTATVTITTELATPTWKAETKVSDCPASTMGGPPNSSSPYCYTVKYTKVKSISQKFTIWFR